MNCKEIKKHLTGYYDSMPEPEIKNSISAHLKGCKKCSQEYSFLLKYKKEMSSLPKWEAPADFLQKLHAKIEQSTTIKRLMEKLFFPLSVKLPLEFAGALAVLIFIIIIVPSDKEENMETALLQQAGKKQILKDTYRAGKPKAPESSAIAGAKPFNAVSPQTNEIIELILAVNSEKPGKTDKAAGTPAQDYKEEKTERVQEEMSKAGTEASEAPSITTKQKNTLDKDDTGAALSMTKTIRNKRKKPSAEKDMNLDFKLKIENIILMNKGKTIKEEYTKTKSLYSITAEIPSEHYKNFLNQLNDLGVFQNPLPDEADVTRPMIKIRIKFLFPY